MKDVSPPRITIERLLPWLVLAFLLVFTYATFFHNPYVGFDFNPTNGQILDVFIASSQDADLRPGDTILRIGSTSWEEIMSSTRQPLFEGVQPGELIPLELRRGEQDLSVMWKIPGPNSQEILARIVNLWFLAYVFWLAGTAALLFLRPKDTRWRLFIAFFYLTAAWLITGNISRWRVWESAVFFRSFIWLIVPVYLHFHWTFPKPFGKIPLALLVSGYLLSAVLTALEWFHLLPPSAYGLGFLPAVAGSVILLILHFSLQPAHRREAGLMGLAILLSFVPMSGISIALLLNEIPPYGGISLLGLPVLPLIYFYVVFWHKLGGLELRANRLISLYLFFILVGTVFIVVITAANAWLDFPGSETSIGILAVLLAGIITAVGYPRFKGFVERQLLGMPLPPENLLQIYTTRITTSLDLPTLVGLLRGEVLPSLLIRQSALLRLDEGGRIESLFTLGVDEPLPLTELDIRLLQQLAERRESISFENGQLPKFPWVRQVLPLRVSDRLTGLWLLGHRSPDDFYAISELPTLQNLANQTAIALTNIEQSEQLRAIYQTNINRYEQERTNLARDLHDNFINRLVVLGMYVDLTEANPRFNEAYRELIEHLRQTISGLRPPILNYGLRTALEEMVDELSEIQDGKVTVELRVPLSDIRYPSNVEEHIYRIVQQATENALRHARAKTIRIYGSLEPETIDLVVEDDGIGFETFERMEISQLLAKGHFGIVGMLERARLASAHVGIQSKPGHGSQISVAWSGIESSNNSFSPGRE